MDRVGAGGLLAPILVASAITPSLHGATHKALDHVRLTLGRRCTGDPVLHALCGDLVAGTGGRNCTLKHQRLTTSSCKKVYA